MNKIFKNYRFKCPSIATKKELFFAATHDYLTNTLSRYGFSLFMDSLYSSVCNERQITLSIVDIDDLGYINDAYGHCAGDIAIQKVSSILMDSFEKDGAVCRWGGDEFVIIHLTSDKHCFLQKMDSIREKISEAFKNKGYPIGLSYGYHIFNYKKGIDINGIIDHADKKLYSYKMFQKGKPK
jgi:diguanylate cyclase (GGDEF)-like protein